MFSEQLEVLRSVQKGLGGPLIFKVADLKKYVDTKSLGVLETRWGKVLDKRRKAREEAEEEKRQQEETAARERERIKQSAQDAVVREHEELVEKIRREKGKAGRGTSGFTDPLHGTDSSIATVDLTDAVDLTDDAPPQQMAVATASTFTPSKVLLHMIY